MIESVGKEAMNHSGNKGKKGRFKMRVRISETCGRAAALIRQDFSDPRFCQAGAGEPGSGV